MTYSDAFNRAVAVILAAEGGYRSAAEAQARGDPGGETNFGISRRSYPNEDIAGMTRERATEIYYRDFWLPLGADALPYPIALVLFDIKVNGGYGVRWLQQALGVTADSVLGDQTRAALAAADPQVIVGGILWRRVVYLSALANWPTEKDGWMKRQFDLHRAALAA